MSLVSRPDVESAIAAPGLDHILSAIDHLGPALADLADPIDRGQTAPARAYELITRSPLLTALIPVADGGHGLDFACYTKVLARLAHYNGAAALGYNMHNVAIGNLFECDISALGKAGAKFRDWVISEVATNGKIFASAASEPSTGARLRGIATTYRRDGDSYILTGHKSFVSLASVADYYVVSARPEDAPNDYEVSHFVVGHGDENITFSTDWNGSALRGTATAEMWLEETRVPADRLYLGVEGMSLFKAVREPHWMAAGYLGAYLGLAVAIVDYTAAYIDGSERHRNDAAITHQLGSMVVRLEATRALVYRAAAAVTGDRTGPETNTLIYAAKYHLGETAQSLAADAVRLTGSASMTADGSMQRLLREVQFCSIMPAKPRDCLDYVARARLGDNMFDVRNQSW